MGLTTVISNRLGPCARCRSGCCPAQHEAPGVGPPTHRRTSTPAHGVCGPVSVQIQLPEIGYRYCVVSSPILWTVPDSSRPLSPPPPLPPPVRPISTPQSPSRAVLCISFLSFPLFASLCSHSTIRRATSNPPLLQQCRRRAPAPATHVRPTETAPPARLARREGCSEADAGISVRCVLGTGLGPSEPASQAGAGAGAALPPRYPHVRPMCAPGADCPPQNASHREGSENARQ